MRLKRFFEEENEAIEGRSSNIYLEKRKDHERISMWSADRHQSIWKRQKKFFIFCFLEAKKKIEYCITSVSF